MGSRELQEVKVTFWAIPVWISWEAVVRRELDCGNVIALTQILLEPAMALMKAVDVRMKKNLPLTNGPWLVTVEDEKYGRTSCHHRRSIEMKFQTVGIDFDRDECRK